MYKVISSLIVVAAAALSTGCAGQVADPTRHNLSYATVGGASGQRPLSGARPIGDIEVIDARSGDRGVIGVRTDRSGGTADIRMNGSLEDYVRDAAEMVIPENGGFIDGSSTLTLQVTVENASINETMTMVNAYYNATVTLKGELFAGNRSIWTGSTTQLAPRRNGKSASDANYAKALNQAMRRAMADLIRQPRFYRAAAE